MPGTLKPSLSYVVVSCLTIAASLFLITLAISAFSRAWDPCSLLGGVVLLPLPSALAYQQYRAAFRLNRGAAKSAATLQFIVGAFSAALFIICTTQFIKGGGYVPWLEFLLPTFAVSVLSGVTGWLNVRWYRGLPDSIEPLLGPRFSLRELLVAVAVLGAMIAITCSFIRSTPPKYAEHVDIADAPFGLPTTAIDISYCQGFRGTIAYEFTIDELKFREWVDSGIGSAESESANVAILQISTPINITRYNALSSDLTGPDSISVSAGLHYSWSYEDRGVYALFDSTTNRAYYFAHFH